MSGAPWDHRCCSLACSPCWTSQWLWSFALSDCFFADPRHQSTYLWIWSFMSIWLACCSTGSCSSRASLGQASAARDSLKILNRWMSMASWCFCSRSIAAMESPPNSVRGRLGIILAAARAVTGLERLLVMVDRATGWSSLEQAHPTAWQVYQAAYCRQFLPTISAWAYSFARRWCLFDLSCCLSKGSAAAAARLGFGWLQRVIIWLSPCLAIF